jgi:MoaA/NifB/PqqE/SkfB family radical SAM enzyme
MLKEKLVRYDALTGEVFSPPQQIFLELTARCNLACVHCSRDYGLPSAGREPELPKEALERLMPWLHRARFVNLNIVGEPLLASHFDWTVEQVGRGSAEINFNTNGLLLHEARCHKLIDAGVHSVAVSFDGMESMGKVRGVPYEVVRERLLTLERVKRERGSLKPHIGLAYTLMRSNAGEMAGLLNDLLPRVRVHAVHVQPLIVFYETLRGENIYAGVPVDALIAEARRICQRHQTELILFRSQFVEDEREEDRLAQIHQLGPYSKELGCSDPFFEVKIRADGQVDACSFGLEAGANVLERDLGEIWNSAWYRRVRLDLLARRYVGRCASCPYIHGGFKNQEAPLRSGVEHSQALRFLGAQVGDRTAHSPVGRDAL